MSLQYIIDGCNVIHHHKFARLLLKKPVDPRAALIKFLINAGICTRGNKLAWVVFDGYPRQDINDMETKRIKILFSRMQSADEKIKRILELTDNPRGTVVVSDDKEIILFSRIMRAQTLSVEDFIKCDDVIQGKGLASEDKKINYSQMCRINEEFKRIWLKEE